MNLSEELCRRPRGKSPSATRQIHGAASSMTAPRPSCPIRAATLRHAAQPLRAAGPARRIAQRALVGAGVVGFQRVVVFFLRASSVR